MSRYPSRKLKAGLLLLFGGVLARNALEGRSVDFQAYWQSVHRMLHGGALYLGAGEGFQGFKYPPPYAFLIAPFSLLDLEWARVLWVILLLLSFGSVVLHTLKQTSWSWPSVLSTLFFWGILNFGLLQGQINPLLMALFFLPWSRTAVRDFSGIWALAAKGPAAALVLTRKWQRAEGPLILRLILFSVGLVVLSVVAILPGYNWDPWLCAKTFLVNISSWGGNMQGAQNGVAHLWAHFSGMSIFSSALGSTAVIWLLWVGLQRWAANFLPADELWAYLAALACILGPAVFAYQMIWAYPAVARIVHRFWQSRSQMAPQWYFLIGCTLTLGLLALLVLQRLNDVFFLQLPGTRSLGVLLVVASGLALGRLKNRKWT